MLTVGELKALLANRPDDQPVLIQLNGSNGFSVEDVSVATEKALWLNNKANRIGRCNSTLKSNSLNT